MLALILCLISLPLILLLIERLAEKRDRRRYRAPGYLVPIDSRRLHILTQGTGSLNVILESGLAASSLSWVVTQPKIAEFAQAIAYDRAGLGWSEPSKSLPNLTDLVSDLDSLVTTLKLSMPLILVGHSFGGLLVRAFAHRYPERVSGVILIDPVSLETYADPTPQNRHRLQMGIQLANRGALLAHLAVVRTALSLVAHGGRKLPSLIGRVSAGKGSSVLIRLMGEVAKLPPETHGPIRSHWSQPASFHLMAAYLSLLPVAAQEAQNMSIPTGIPVIILSAATASAAELAERDIWASAHPASRHSQIPNTTHWLQLDCPDMVAAAVRELSSAIE